MQKIVHFFALKLLLMQHIIAGSIIALAAFFALIAKKLTTGGAIAGAVVAFCVFLGFSYTGLGMLAAFFILGLAATGFKKEIKAFEPGGHQRTAAQVLANGGAAAVFSICNFFYPSGELLMLMAASALASATADTLSSELGTVYGKKFYNIINFKKEKKGLDGVVSLEGTVIGMIGSGIIAAIFSWGFGYDINFFVILTAGTIGNLTDSLLGATAERRHLIGNDLVNLLNTLSAAMAAFLISHLA